MEVPNPLRNRNLRWCVAAAVGLLACAELAPAQTGPELLLKPFRRTDQLELDLQTKQGANSVTDDFDPDPLTAGEGGRYRYQAHTYDLQGRVRLTYGQSDEGFARAQPRLGFRTSGVDIQSADPNLPGGLLDASVGAGMGVLAYGGWIGGASVGVGYAGADSTSSSRSTYYLGNFAVGRTFANGDTFGLVLDLNTNRTILPDWVLPGFQYRKGFDVAIDRRPSRDRTPPRPQAGEATDETEPGEFGGPGKPLVLAVGFPFSGIEWRPVDPLLVQVTYVIPFEFQIRSELTVTEGIALYGSLGSRLSAFVWDELDGDDRLFFRQRLVEGGLLWDLEDRLKVLFAVGYAFDQRYSVGEDTRDLTTRTGVRDDTYARIGVELRL